MAVALLILKIIGIVLLCLLTLIILFANIALLCPIFYQGHVAYENDFVAEGKITFLAKLLQLQFKKDTSGVHIRCRIFGLKRRLGNKEKKSDDFRKIDNESAKEEPVKEKPIKKEPEKLESKKLESTETKKEELEKQTKDSQVKKEKEPELNSDFDSKNEPAKTGIRSKIQKGKEKISDIKGILKDEANQEMIRLFIKELKKLLHHYGPRSLKGTLSFSIGDPALTGLMTGFISLFPVVYREGYSISPDFQTEEAYVKANLYLKGHIRLIHTILALIRAYRNPNVRKLIKQYR